MNNTLTSTLWRGLRTHCKPLRASKNYYSTSLYPSQLRSQHYSHWMHPVKCLSIYESSTCKQLYCTQPKMNSAQVDGGTNDSNVINSEKFITIDDEPIDRRALVELETELFRQQGEPVPDVITPSQWEALMSKQSRGGRRKLLQFYFLNQVKKERKEQKRAAKSLIREKYLETIDKTRSRYVDENGHIQYGLWCNSIFIRITDQTMHQFNHGRLMNALMYGQQLVIDLGFDANMTPKERQSLSDQILMSISSNRSHPDPSYIHFCNAQPDTKLMKMIEKNIPTLFNPEYPLTVHEKSYLDIFPKKKLVYLTPHCKDDLNTYDRDAVYIIGGIADLGNKDPLTLAKAKREGIKMRKFPLDRYLPWGQGHKTLTINHSISILLDFKHTGDWTYALRHVPKRKLKSHDDFDEGKLLKSFGRPRRPRY